MFGRNAWAFWQALCSFAVGFTFYSAYLMFNELSHGAIGAWFDGGVSWMLAYAGISSDMLESLLRGQNIIGFISTIIAFIVFLLATRAQAQAGRP